VAARNIAGLDAAFEPRAIPFVEFTDPEVAECGLSEQQAAKENRRVKVAKFPWAASGRAVTLGHADGLTKLIIDPDTKTVLGVGIVGTGAGELIAEGVLAVETAAKVSDIASAIHPHPTLSETVMEAAEAFLGHSLHFYRPRRP
jgi:dihydrolipoamide dehydrogenase